MDSYKLAIKFFLQNPEALHLEELAPIFHRWIQGRAVPNHVLIDVADYAHVTNGPGIVLISHEANFSMDCGEGRPGLLYTRKRPLQGSFGERLRTVTAATIGAAVQIERDIPALKFNTGEILLRLNDRLLAPNSAETFNAVRGELQGFIQGMYGGESTVQCEHHSEPHCVFEVRMRITPALPLASLAQRIG